MKKLLNLPFLLLAFQAGPRQTLVTHTISSQSLQKAFATAKTDKIQVYAYLVKGTADPKKADLGLATFFSGPDKKVIPLGAQPDSATLKNEMSWYVRYLHLNGVAKAKVMQACMLEVGKSQLVGKTGLELGIYPFAPAKSYRGLPSVQKDARTISERETIDSVGGCKFPPGCLLFVPPPPPVNLQKILDREYAN